MITRQLSGERPISPFTEFVQSLRTAQVRDLATSCLGENLLNCPDLAGVGLYPDNLDSPRTRRWLEELDRQPQPLLHYLARRKSTRLGLYFEALWLFFWQNYGETRIHTHNLQIEDRGRTLGALDFIIEQENTLVHIEAAVKFYLLRGEDPHLLHNWIGPNASDTLERKLSHLQSHQLPLLHQAATREKLSQLSLPSTDIDQCLILKGRLFIRQNTPLENFPAFAHQTHNLWFYLSRLEPPDGPDHYAIIPRNRWLGPAVYHSCFQPLSFSQLKRALQLQISSTRQARMVAQLQQNGAGVWREVRRFCVVEDYWPGTDRPLRKT